MGGARGAGRGHDPLTEAVATIVYSARALGRLERAFDRLRKENPEAVMTPADAISSGVESLRAHTLLGRRVHGEIRELVISYGTTGYVALYRFLVPQDEVRLFAIRHQREIGFVPRRNESGPRGAICFECVGSEGVIRQSLAALPRRAASPARR